MAETQEAAEGVSFTVGDASINRVQQFKYLGKILQESDNDYHAVDHQLRKTLISGYGTVNDGLFLQGDIAIYTFVWIGIMGNYIPQAARIAQLSFESGEAYYWSTYTGAAGWNLRLPLY